MDATDLIGRLVTNSHGAEFVITGLSFDAQNGTVIFEIDELENGRLLGCGCGIPNLNGWTVHNRLPESNRVPLTFEGQQMRALDSRG